MNEVHNWEKKNFTRYHGVGHNFVDMFWSQILPLSWHTIIGGVEDEIQYVTYETTEYDTGENTHIDTEEVLYVTYG